MKVHKTRVVTKALVGSAIFSLFAGCSGGQFNSGQSSIAGLRLGSEDKVEIKGNAPGSDADSDPFSDGKTSSGEDVTPQNDSATTPPTTAVVPGAPPPRCVAESPNTVVRSDDTLEFTSADFKPGVYGEPSATKGLAWPNGGRNDRNGVAPATVDWRLCDKIGFVELGHSLTRTISFRSLDRDGVVSLTVHRHRRVRESYGDGIWYHWAPNISWKDNRPLFNFKEHKDYAVSCSYTEATDKWLCSFEVKPPTAVDCSPYQSKGCTKFSLKN